MKQVIKKIAIILIVILLLINISTNCKYVFAYYEFSDPNTYEVILDTVQGASDEELIDLSDPVLARYYRIIDSYIKYLDDTYLKTNTETEKANKKIREIREAESRLDYIITIKQRGEVNSRDVNNWSVQVNETLSPSASEIIGKIIRFLRNISIIVTVVVIIILGIKYMIGSVQQKADYKKSFITIIIGVAVVTLITNIVDFIFSIV